MAGDERRRSTLEVASEDKLLRRLRIIAAIVIITMIVLLVTADTLGRLFISADFHASELILGTLIGALLLLLGIEAVNRVPGLPKSGDKR